MAKYTYLHLNQPSISLNAPNIRNMAPMKYHPRIPWDLSAHEIIKRYANSAFRHLVFNCHGYASRPNFPVPHLSLGTVFHAGNVSAFDPLASSPLTRVIWLASCNLAYPEAGKAFVREIALHSRCYVVGATTEWPDEPCPANCILDPTRMFPCIATPRGGMIGQESFRALSGTLGFW